jgi:hypothetical protein
LVLVGDGALVSEVRARAEQVGLGDKVTFAGYRSGADFVRWLQALDEVWILGLGNDFSGRSAAQARATGARVIAVREGALPDYADVVVGEDPDAIARASLGTERRSFELPSKRDIAARVLKLYEKARSGA